ncbi:MAG: hypothetical protein U5S82_11910 [Gammaproteobacteria bacterium]|nr:hypothetical protein [Gammaproteobacteria bacterium]
MAAVTPARVEAFARDVLGCQCPAEVFARVRVDEAPNVGDVVLRDRITVGDRLLIYVVEGDRVDGAGGVTELCQRGAAERDARGLHRFRLVIAGDDGADKGHTAMADLPDDRCHIHRVSREEAAWGDA